MGSRKKKNRRRRNARAREEKARREVEAYKGGFWMALDPSLSAYPPEWEPPRFIVGKQYTWCVERYIRRRMNAGYRFMIDPYRVYASLTGLWTYSEAPGRMRFTNPQGEVVTYGLPVDFKERHQVEVYEPWTG